MDLLQSLHASPRIGVVLSFPDITITESKGSPNYDCLFNFIPRATDMSQFFCTNYCNFLDIRTSQNIDLCFKILRVIKCSTRNDDMLYTPNPNGIKEMNSIHVSSTSTRTSSFHGETHFHFVPVDLPCMVLLIVS